MAAFAAVFMALQIARYTQKSATWDEPIHLTAGYAALAEHDYRVDPSHPPLLRMWAAIPLTMLPLRTLDVSEIDRTPVRDWYSHGYDLAHRFLYVGNDADRLLYSARFMMALLGVALGLLVFAWAYEWLGWHAALLAVALYVLEPNLSAHASLVTTDFGVTLFVFAAVYALWRLSRRFSGWNVAAFAAAVALAAVAKFSAVLLIPIVAVLLVVVAGRRSELTSRRIAITVAAVCVATVVAIWAAYGFHYRPSPTPAWTFTAASMDDAASAPALTATIEWIDRHRLLPNAFSEGFLFSQVSSRQMPAFWAGQVKAGGWWYYFPLAFLLKTPLTLLLLIVGGVATLWIRRSTVGLPNAAFLLVPPAIWMAAAMVSHINIGVRHILPVYPFLILTAAAGLGALVAQSSARRMVAAAAMILLAVEFGHAYPHPLSFFNVLIGGPSNGYRYLADSNLGWGSNLKLLKRWMDRNGVDTINLAYFGSADPDYYGIHATYLPGSPKYEQPRLSRPQLPGFVAISATVLDGVYLPPWWQHLYAGFSTQTPVAVLGHSLRIYWVERWPEPATPLHDDEALHTLADGLFLGLGWPEHAIVHYREYLRRRPRDADAWDTMAVALSRTGRDAEARDGLEHALALDPGNDHIRENLDAVMRRLTQSRRQSPRASLDFR